MKAVAQQTPRPWDGRRALRFLTSLAMLALAVTLRLPGPDAVAPAEAPAPAAVAVVAETPAPASRTEPEAGVSAAGTMEIIEIVPAPRLGRLPGGKPEQPRRPPTGEIPRSAGSRAPPAR
ncbi:hypothetical protein [Actinoplanes aureus]|uniref:Uncharacterized protein n=1 Tax=Actinoplanes aureus TaxID=2792083 RepID=A0A931G8A5_9ACTN|nr:hypothetical protein [Actinoplanes aureus]MBG0569054.1 hypothetical protein [Actinoplanes aureus]